VAWLGYGHDKASLVLHLALKYFLKGTE